MLAIGPNAADLEKSYYPCRFCIDVGTVCIYSTNMTNTIQTITDCYTTMPDWLEDAVADYQSNKTVRRALDKLADVLVAEVDVNGELARGQTSSERIETAERNAQSALETA